MQRQLQCTVGHCSSELRAKVSFACGIQCRFMSVHVCLRPLDGHARGYPQPCQPVKLDYPTALPRSLTVHSNARRTLYDAKPKFDSFLQSVLSGKVAQAKFTPKPREPEIFIPSAGDDNMLVARKRKAAPSQGRPKRPRR